MSKSLLRELIMYAEEIIDDYQGGFQPGMSTINQIFLFCQILEMSWEYKKEIFMDFKQAYDFVHRSTSDESQIGSGLR